MYCGCLLREKQGFNKQTLNNGAHFENVVVRQLTANGFEPYFCKKKNLGELDFVIEMAGKVVPIDVKSGKNYKTHKALDHFMSVDDYHLEKAYVFSVGNSGQIGNVIYLPIYMSYLLKEKTIDSMIINVDLEASDEKKSTTLGNE